MTLEPPRKVRTGRSVAEVYDYGAHVWSWTRDGDPVLWNSATSFFEPGKALRGGVPICWPWFGAGRSGDLVPAHGYARLSRWNLTELVERPDSTMLGYCLTPAEAPGALPGEDWTATYEVRVGDELELTLTVANRGPTPFTYEAALHTYLTVGDVRQVVVGGLDGVSYFDKVAGARARQVGDVTFVAETDRVYDHGGEVLVEDPKLGRRLRITMDGAANTVVWNPWIAKAGAMPDFGDDEWPGMLCIEAGNISESAVTLAPGAEATLRYRLTVEM